MAQPRVRDEHATIASSYGLGLMSGGQGELAFFGHTGGFQGFVTRTVHVEKLGLTVSVLTHAQDGFAYGWVDGVANILSAFRQHGAPAPRLKDWRGRYWGYAGATDVIPMGDRVRLVAPALYTPFDAMTWVVRPTGKDSGIVEQCSGYGSSGEPFERLRDGDGTINGLRCGGGLLKPREALEAEMRARYGQ
jgi:D-alanyl-D-alanine carboxypeptidase